MTDNPERILAAAAAGWTVANGDEMGTTEPWAASRQRGLGKPTTIGAATLSQVLDRVETLDREWRVADLQAKGWHLKEAGSGPWAVKHLGGHPVTQKGQTIEQLLSRCESWEASQSGLKPEHRIDYVEVPAPLDHNVDLDSDSVAA